MVNRIQSADDQAATELFFFIENDRDLYRQQFMPIVENIKRKLKAGKYNHALAVKLWGYLVESGAKKYNKEFGDGSLSLKMFNKPTREIVAQRFADEVLPEIQSGNYGDIGATRKANPAKRPAPKKRALSRPSQVTKKAPSKRLVARRKVAAKKPVKGYFPNPRKAEKLVTLQIEIDRGKGWEFYTNFQHGKSHVRAITEMAKDAAQRAAKMNPSWMVRVIKK